MSTFQHDFRCRQPVRSKRTRAAAWTDGSLYCPIHSDYGGLCPGRRHHYTFPGSAPRATLDHLYGSPRGGPEVGPIRLDRDLVPRERAAGRRAPPNSPSWCRASRMSREAPLAGHQLAPLAGTNSRCCRPRERQLVRDRGHSRCTHSIAPIRGLPGSVPDRRAPSIGPREVRTFRFG